MHVSIIKPIWREKIICFSNIPKFNFYFRRRRERDESEKFHFYLYLRSSNELHQSNSYKFFHYICCSWNQTGYQIWPFVSAYAKALNKNDSHDPIYLSIFVLLERTVISDILTFSIHSIPSFVLVLLIFQGWCFLCLLCTQKYSVWYIPSNHIMSCVCVCAWKETTWTTWMPVFIAAT